MTVREYLKENTLIFDGSMGTYFASKYDSALDKCELANIKNEKLVYDIHKEYIEAGCNAIKTNTFGANLPEMDFDEELLKNVVAKGWEIAQKAAENENVFVFADMGPIQTAGENVDKYFYIKTIDIFLSLGAENFLFETFSNSDYLSELAEYIKEKNPDAFIITSFAVQPDGYTRTGVFGYELLKELSKDENIDYVGINCVSGPRHMLEFIKNYKLNNLKISVMPNAGYPTVINNRTFFDSSPEYFAMETEDIAKLGVKILGGCCGTTPQYIRFMAERVHRLSSEETAEGEEKKQVSHYIAKRENTFRNKLESGKKVIAVELDSPLNSDLTKFMDGAIRLKEHGVDIMTIADCPIARARMDSSILACKLKRELNMDVLPHLTCRDRNINATKALLLGLNAEGVDNVLVVTGDPVPTAERSEVKSVYNFNSRMLAKYISTLNETVFDINEITLYGALNINAHNFDIQLRLAKEKEKNGMYAFLTQPVMTAEGLENLKKAKKELKGKILGGIIPVLNYRNACFMDSEISGIKVDKKILELYKDKTAEEGRELGIKIAVEIARQIKDYCDGYYLMTPFGKTDIICEIMDRIREFEG